MQGIHNVRQPLALLFIIGLLVSAVASARPVEGLQSQIDESRKIPPFKWIRSRNVDIKHVAIDLRFDWQKKQAFGTTAVTLASFNPTNKITLDAGMLTINSVTSANGASLKFNYDGGDKNDGLEILLDRVYSAGEDLTVKIDYHTNWVNASDPNNLWGSFGKGLRFLESTSADPIKRRQIWTMGEPESNRYWFPCYDSPNDLRTSEFSATVDKNLTAISNGNLVETKTNPDGTRTFHWKMDTPYANHLTSFVVGEYVDVKQIYEDVEFHSFGYRDEIQAVAASVLRLTDMARFFSKMTGVKYPYPSYSQVFVQDSPGFMGNAGASTITENMIDDDRTHADFYYLWDLTEAETLAQQWFGSHLTARDWSHFWLNKSMAHFFSGLYNEHKNGHEEYLIYQIPYDHDVVYLNDWNSGIRHPVVTRNYENALAFTTDNYSVFRGGLVLRMLRKYLGEENWWRAIRQYVKANAGKSVSTEDLRLAVEEATGESMEWFFDQWLYKMGHPIFEVTKNYDAGKKQLTLNVKQTQKVDPKDEYPQVEFFAGKLEIEIDGRVEQVWLEPKAENVYSFASAQAPKLVGFDYESTWIKELKFEKTLDELLYQFQNDKDILGRRSAMLELVKLAKTEKTSAADRTKVYTAFRDVIASGSYWRLRAMAISQLQSLLAPATETKPALDEATIAMLTTTIKNDKSWVRAGALTFLGATRDPKFADLYLNYFNDESDRVINAAANALGKSKSPKAFDALAKLVNKPSWKNQSLISALNGLRNLGDPRGYEIAYKALSDLNSPHWTLATPIWDYRIAAAQTIAALGKSDAAYPLVFAGFKKAMAENDLHGTFYHALLIATLADPRGQEAFDLLKAKFKDDANAMLAVTQYETQFKDAIKQP